MNRGYRVCETGTSWAVTAARGACYLAGTTGGGRVSARGVKDGGDVTGAFLLHVLVGREGGAELRREGVDGREGEDIKEDEAAVIEKVADCATGEGEIRVRKDGDDANAVDTVDVRHDLFVQLAHILQHRVCNS